MARIRSIKPEFFSSETMARVPRGTRLTFIGLWTYVDDNGVGIDNDRLITAALYALDEDFVEELAATHEDLAALERLGVISRYTVAGKRYLHITSWDEHQKISHPGKPRYPLPPADSGNTPDPLQEVSGNSPEDFANPSGTSPATLRPEVGAGKGSREVEQGAGNASAAVPTQPPLLVIVDNQPLASLADVPPGFDEFWHHWPRKVSKPPAAKAWEKAIKKADPAGIVEACRDYAERCVLTDREIGWIPHPATWLNEERWNDNLDAAMPLPTNRRPPPRESTTDAAVAAGNDALAEARRMRGTA